MPFDVTRDPHSPNDLTAVFRRLADALDPDYDVIDTMDLLVEAATRRRRHRPGRCRRATPRAGLDE